MASKMPRKRISLRRKLHIQRVLSNSNSVMMQSNTSPAKKRTSITKSTVLYIYKLKVALETVKREYEKLVATRKQHISLLNNIKDNKDVKIEKVREGTFAVRVKCEKGGEKLVSILECFEEMCLNVEEARVSCENGFSLEAIVVAEDQTLDVTVRDVTQVLLKAIGKQSGEMETPKFENCCNNL